MPKVIWTHWRAGDRVKSPGGVYVFVGHLPDGREHWKLSRQQSSDAWWNRDHFMVSMAKKIAEGQAKRVWQQRAKKPKRGYSKKRS
jgi:hypothetical protein